jgi:hypothetical protein
MDPDANLRELRGLLDRYLHEDLRSDLHPAHPDQPQFTDQDIERAFELVEALDAWLTKGGFLPSAWIHDEPVHDAAMDALGVDRAEHRRRVVEQILEHRRQIRARTMEAIEGFRRKSGITPAE